MEISNYIKDGKIKRSSIARSIADGKLSDSDLEMLINDTRISAGFIGDKLEDKKPQSEWNKDYLENLVYTAFAGPFNADYLLHLYEVSQYVRNTKTSIAKMHKIVIGAIIIVLVIVAGIIVFSFVLH